VGAREGRGRGRAGRGRGGAGKEGGGGPRGGLHIGTEMSIIVGVSARIAIRHARPWIVAAALVLLVLGMAASARGATVTVRPGDTLSAIAARSGVSVGALARANAIANPNVVQAGRRLVVPSGSGAVGSGGTSAGGGSYTVRPGDTLSGIAASHGTNAAALAALNGIRDPNRLAVGRVLSVPAASPSPSWSAPTPAGEVASLIASASARYGVDPALARAIAWQESRWTQSARSHVGAIGVMQLMPATARWIGPAMVGRRIDPHVLADNIEGGVAYLAWLRRRTSSDNRAIMAYYQGLASLRDIGPYDDTLVYLRRVVSYVGNV
jgi:N-acetylmuramoyl-L-alanine amidase